MNKPTSWSKPKVNVVKNKETEVNNKSKMMQEIATLKFLVQQHEETIKEFVMYINEHKTKKATLGRALVEFKKRIHWIGTFELAREVHKLIEIIQKDFI